MKVVVVIVTHNGKAWLTNCLKSVFSSTIPVEVIVIDNFSTDKTCDIIKDFPKVQLLKKSENLGFGRANNIGISQALNEGADYVFLLNQDAYLDTNTLEVLIQHQKNNRDYGILSPIHLNGPGLALDFNFSEYLCINKSFLFDALKQSYTKTIYEVPFVNAAGWLISKEVLEHVGGFDPIFYHYGEDLNYCQRLLFHGFKIGIVPDVFLRHDREERLGNKFSNEDDRLKDAERILKAKWANINKDTEENITRYQLKLKKIIIKLALQLKFNRLKYYIKELKLVKRIVPEIQSSRMLTKTKGTHYLQLNPLDNQKNK